MSCTREKVNYMYVCITNFVKQISLHEKEFQRHVGMMA